MGEKDQVRRRLVSDSGISLARETDQFFHTQKRRPSRGPDFSKVCRSAIYFFVSLLILISLHQTIPKMASTKAVQTFGKKKVKEQLVVLHCANLL